MGQHLLINRGEKMKREHWKKGDDNILTRAKDLLLQGKKTIVSPTKVGYVIITVDYPGLERKFMLKNRPKTKPSVVLCTSAEHVEQLADINEDIKKLYRSCEKKNVLLGCILPWKSEAVDQYIPKDGTRELVMDKRNTSCFVICFGEPSEKICKKLWIKHQLLVFASSANPSGKGNRGQIEGVGEQILTGVDMAIEADDYVAKQLPHSTTETRYEQGVMVSMVDAQGKLVDIPIVIRKGLMIDQIMLELSSIWDKFDYRHGLYY